MAGGIDWFRWHHGSVSDPKFQLVAKKANVSVAVVIAVWASLLEASSVASDRGNPGDIDFESMDCGLGLDDGTCLRVYGRMADRDLLTEDGRIASWEKRQSKREREGDNSTERVRAFREKQRQETPGNATQHQETPRVEKSREEKKEKKETLRASRLPADWELPEGWRAWARKERPDLDSPTLSGIADDFFDYWIAKPGKDGTKLDWLATWRKWVRNANAPRTGMNGAKHIASITVPSTAADETAARLAEQAEHARLAAIESRSRRAAA